MHAGNHLSGSTEWLRELSITSPSSDARIDHPALLHKLNTVYDKR